MCHCSMDGKLLDLSWTLLGGEVKMVKWPAIIWFHWTPESIPLWSEFRCIQMIFQVIFLGLVQCCGEPWRNAAMPPQDNSFQKLLQKYSRQTIPFRNSEIQNRTPEIYNIQKHWQHTHSPSCQAVSNLYRHMLLKGQQFVAQASAATFEHAQDDRILCVLGVLQNSGC